MSQAEQREKIPPVLRGLIQWLALILVVGGVVADWTGVVQSVRDLDWLPMVLVIAGLGLGGYFTYLKR
jgi:hypothetical protein